MTFETLCGVVFVAYASLLWELTALHVPSAASTLSIWRGPASLQAAYSPSRRHVFELSWARKLALFVLPVLAVWAVYLYPPIALIAQDPLRDQLYSPTSATNMAAAVLIVAGRAITLISVLTLRGAGPRAAGRGLASQGLFAYSRNPGLVGMYVFASGLWLSTPSLAMLAGLLVYVVYMDFKVRMEEDYLENTFGDEYRAYVRRTRRYLP